MIPFTSSPNTMGIELELQLLDQGSLDLQDRILPLMELIGESPYVRPEFIQNTVEVSCRPSTSARECQEHLREIAVLVRDACKDLNITLCGAGTHPFCKKLATITPLPRYESMEKRAGILSHTQVSFATHVHLGVESGDEAMLLMRKLKPLLPVLIAVSASSPFWRNHPTGFVSYRQRILAATRSYGIPPGFDSWSDFCRFYQAGQKAALFGEIRDIHWDIRPHPGFGTLEVRVMDAQPTLAAAAELAELLYGLRLYFLSTSETDELQSLAVDLPWWAAKENSFQASRLGLDAPFITSSTGTVRPLRDLAADVLEASRMGLEGRVDDNILPASFAPSAQRQIDAYQRRQSTRDVTAALRDELTAELDLA